MSGRVGHIKVGATCGLLAIALLLVAVLGTALLAFLSAGLIILSCLVLLKGIE